MTGNGLIVGVGNPDRGDDGAGIHAARRLRPLRRVAEVTDCSTLLDLWAEEDDVTVIDATSSGAEPGTIVRLDGLCDVLAPSAPRSTHSLGLAESVELARALGKLPSRLTVYGIEASSFHHGESLSPQVEAAVETLARSLGGTG